MTKLEEKFKEIFSFVGLRENELNHIAEKCAEIAEQECIGFDEWIHYNSKVYPDGWHYKGDAYTTKQLFQLYQKSKENE